MFNNKELEKEYDLIKYNKIKDLIFEKGKLIKINKRIYQQFLV
jgi:hypothetical protein